MEQIFAWRQVAVERIMQRKVVVREKEFDFGIVCDAVSFFIEFAVHAFLNGHFQLLHFVFRGNENSVIVSAYFECLKSVSFSPSGGRSDPVHFHRISIPDKFHCFAGFRVDADIDDVGSKHKIVHGKPHIFSGKYSSSPEFFPIAGMTFLSLFLLFFRYEKYKSARFFFCGDVLPSDGYNRPVWTKSNPG